MYLISNKNHNLLSLCFFFFIFGSAKLWLLHFQQNQRQIIENDEYVKCIRKYKFTENRSTMKISISLISP